MSKHKIISIETSNNTHSLGGKVGNAYMIRIGVTIKASRMSELKGSRRIRSLEGLINM
jgi:hypothetical protein